MHCIWYFAALESISSLNFGGEGAALRTSRSTDLRETPGRATTRERLIVDYLPLVRSVARDFVREGADFDELVQVGSIGLIKAVDRFDPERGVNFAAFARPTVAGEIHRHLRDAVPAVRPPRRLHELNGRLRRLRRELGGRVSIGELAVAVGTSTAEAEAAADLERTSSTVPLEDETARAGDPYAASEDRLFVESCLDTLDPRERRIVTLRFYGDLSQREIAREIGISQIHVSRLLDRSLQTLRRRAEHVAPASKRVSRIVLPASNSYTDAHGARGKTRRRVEANL